MLLKCSKWLSEYGGIYFGSSRWRVKTGIEEFHHHHHHRHHHHHHHHRHHHHHHHHHHHEDDPRWGGIRLLSFHVCIRSGGEDQKLWANLSQKRIWKPPMALQIYINIICHQVYIMYYKFVCIIICHCHC